MKVQEIEAQSFMRWDKARLTLPDSGVVLITGHNGAGKSTLIEAVSQAAWGKSVRGTTGWRKGEKGGVRLTTPAATITRSSSGGGSQKLVWTTGEDGSGNYPTKTKSQAKLNESIGTFAAWERSCVFSSHEAARFTLATDKQRKQLLEELTGLDRFEAAYKAAGSDKLAAQKRYRALESKAQLIAAEISGLEAQLVQAQQVRSDYSGPPVGDLQRSLKAHDEALREAQELARAFSPTLDKAQAALTKAMASDQAAKDKLGRLKQTHEHAQCPTCLQDIVPHVAQNLQYGASQDAEQAGAEVAMARRIFAQHKARAQELQHVISQAGLAKNTAQTRLEQAKRDAALAKTWQGRADDIATQLQSKYKEQAHLETSCAEALLVVQELEEVCAVLGTKGVRASILASALAALEVSANMWLDELGLGDLSISLDSQKLQKSGKVVDEIGFEVAGAGGGYGYKASSGGERRRIDIALTLALADLTSGSTSAQSTLFADEIFDALDDDGVRSAVSVLNTISQNRCVVVISHSDALAAHLPNCIHYQVSAGHFQKIS